MFDLTLQRKGSLISCPSHTHIHTRAFTLTKPIHNLRQRTQRSVHRKFHLSEQSELLFFPIFYDYVIHLMLEDRTMLETDAFATKVELISTPRSPRLILKVLGYKGSVVFFLHRGEGNQSAELAFHANLSHIKIT